MSEAIPGTVSAEAPFGIPDNPLVDQFEWEQSQRIRQLRAQLTEARRVLKLVEWSHDDACPVCYRYERHARDCALAKELL